MKAVQPVVELRRAGRHVRVDVGFVCGDENDLDHPCMLTGMGLPPGSALMLLGDLFDTLMRVCPRDVERVISAVRHPNEEGFHGRS